MSGASVDPLIETLDYLAEDDLLKLHREVCRRAARIYGVKYKQVRDRNFKTAMAVRDTRFVKGLSAIGNMERSHLIGRGESV